MPADPLQVLQLLATLGMAFLVYVYVKGRWSRRENEKLEQLIGAFRTRVNDYWFGEVTGKGKPLRDLLLASEISPRLTSEIRKWLTVKEFEQKIREPPPSRKDGGPSRRRLMAQYATPDKGWWWRLEKLFHGAALEFTLNKENYLTKAEDQLKSSDTGGDSKRTVYPDLTEAEFEDDIERFQTIRNELSSIIRIIHFSSVLGWITVLVAALATFAGLTFLADGLAFQGPHAIWLPSFVIAITTASILVTFYPVFGWILYSWSRNFEWSTANLLTELLRDFILLAIAGFGFYSFSYYLPSFALYGLVNSLTGAWGSLAGRLVILGGVSLLALLLAQHSVIFAMERLAKRFRFEYDETFASVIRFFVLIYILMVASAAFVLGFHAELGISTPDTVIIVYTVVGTLITAAVGYASRDSIEGFFAGLMLRVNPTFEVGDRIILEDFDDKRICDVREIGLRTVRLYDIMSNTEMFVPNGKLSDMIVTNVSRPDLELRIQVPVMIRPMIDTKTKEDSLSIVERILIDVAYAEPEVNQTAMTDAEIAGVKGRISIKTAWEKLIQNHLDVTKVELLTLENAEVHKTMAAQAMSESLTKMIEARAVYRQAAEKNKEEQRLEAIKEVLVSYNNLRRIVDSLAESRPWLKDDEYIRVMKDELSKEPVVYSTFGISGNTEYITATLAAFATNLQRRFEVENRLNKVILDRLEPRGLLVRGVEPRAR